MVEIKSTFNESFKVLCANPVPESSKLWGRPWPHLGRQRLRDSVSVAGHFWWIFWGIWNDWLFRFLWNLRTFRNGLRLQDDFDILQWNNPTGVKLDCN